MSYDWGFNDNDDNNNHLNLDNNGKKTPGQNNRDKPDQFTLLKSFPLLV